MASKSLNQSGLLFSFEDMKKEIVNMKKLASPFLDDHAKQFVIDAWQNELKHFQNLPFGTKVVWEIKEEHPLKTRLSDGKYQLRGKGKTVQGQLTMIWDIVAGDIRKRIQEKPPHKFFALVGKASIKLNITKYQGNDDGEELARWRFEVGDSESPGCHFHMQVLGGEQDNVFPKSLPIPRFPGFLVTPLDALDFLLGELFQIDWPKRQAQDTDEVRLWSRSQQARLQKIVKWQMGHLNETKGSPWVTLKKEKPPIALLI